jgi:hypothetical protein
MTEQLYGVRSVVFPANYDVNYVRPSIRLSGHLGLEYQSYDTRYSTSPGLVFVLRVTHNSSLFFDDRCNLHERPSLIQPAFIATAIKPVFGEAARKSFRNVTKVA